MKIFKPDILFGFIEISSLNHNPAQSHIMRYVRCRSSIIRRTQSIMIIDWFFFVAISIETGFFFLKRNTIKSFEIFHICFRTSVLDSDICAMRQTIVNLNMLFFSPLSSVAKRHRQLLLNLQELSTSLR